MSEYKLKKTKVEEKVVGTYKKIEDGVVNAYKNVEDAVVGTYKKIEDKFVDVVHKQSGDKSIQWIKPSEHLSYQMPEIPFEISASEPFYSEQNQKYLMQSLLAYKEGNLTQHELIEVEDE